jgi:hypothetical protein
MKNSGGLGNKCLGERFITDVQVGPKDFSPKIPNQTNFEFGDQTMAFKKIYSS